jgi:hypothetical protein
MSLINETTMTNTLSKTFTFSDLESQLLANFSKLSAGRLFYVEIDRDEIWDLYLGGFDEVSRQEHNCNCCKSFLRQFAGIVTIENNQMVSIWDNLEVSQEYNQSIENIRNYIHSRPITDLFLSEQKKCGVQKNLDRVRNIYWNHFFLEVPSSVVRKKDVIPTQQGQARDDKNVLKRSLDELKLEAGETVLELIGQNSLYRGKEFQPLVEKFVAVSKQYKQVPDSEKNNFCWTMSLEVGTVLSRIRNTSIGTLLVDLSAGMDLDTAVTRFEKVVAPTNYKRPTSLVTPRMVEQAKEKLADLGLLDSLERRYANETDLSVNDILFTDRPSTLADVFAEVAKDTTVNPRAFSKIEEIGIEDFLSNVVPKAKSVEVLLENSHMGNFVSLLTAQNKEAPSLFKWDNNFSWSYSGAVTDSIKERVKQAGGNVVGELRTSLSWFNYDDLDIHVIEPNGNPIYFRSKRSTTSGVLDVDMNAGGCQSRTPVENIIWTNKNAMLEGTYQVIVHNYSRREMENSGFVVQIECGGEVFDFEFHNNPKNQELQRIAEFDYSKTTGLTFKGEVKSNVVSKEKWGLKTNQFHKVTKLLLSPNHWGRAVGNKHYLLMLEGCVSNEAPRPFFNEFLKPELEEHRKVFEILGSKVKVEETPNQLSGLGFSETLRAGLVVKVTGQFTRTLKVTI